MNKETKNTEPFFKRYISGLYTKEEIDDLTTLINSSQQREENIHEMDKIWSEAQHINKDLSKEKYNEYKNEAKELLDLLKKPQKKSTHFFVPVWTKYAASIALLIGITWSIFTISRNTTESNIQYLTITVTNGKHRQVKLSDGSVLLLNAGTTLRFPNIFEGEERRIYLDGEAYLEVAENKEKPFIIQSDDITVKVLGTKFNVKAYTEDDQYNICVESGKVQVDIPDAVVNLTADQQIIVDKESKDFRKQKESALRVLNWREGGLYFNQTPLSSVINEIKRLYDCKIALAKNINKKISISGEHDNQNLEFLLNSICYATGLKYKKENDEILIYKP